MSSGVLAAKGQRSGKFRHIFGQESKQNQQYKEIRNILTNGNSNYLSVNSKFFAIAKASGGGSVIIHPLSKPGRLGNQVNNTLDVHNGKVLDTQFHPFINNMIATASEDTNICVTSFPIDGPTERITESDVKLKGHSKKVGLIQFNPTTNNIITSASFDRTIKLWNIETSECVSTYSGLHAHFPLIFP